MLAVSKLPKLAKCRLVTGRHLRFRDARPEDAAFILSLRLDHRLGRFLSSTDPDLQRQQRWLEKYRASTDQVYFVVEGQQQNPIGTARIYSPNGGEVTWGSFIMTEGMQPRCSIECVLMIHAYVLHMGFETLWTDIQRENISVWKFSEVFGASRTHERDNPSYYRIDRPQMLEALSKFRRYLPEGIKVED